MNSLDITKRVENLVLENFRGFKGKKRIDLDADIVLITGKNGTGKSSLLYALDLFLNKRPSYLSRKCGLSQGESNGSLCINGHAFQSSERIGFYESVQADDTFSNLYEKASVFYMDEINNIDLESITDIFNYDKLPDVKNHLDQALKEWIPKLEKEYLVNSVDEKGRRSIFVNEFLSKLDDLRRYNYEPLLKLSRDYDTSTEEKVVLLLRDLQSSIAKMTSDNVNSNVKVDLISNLDSLQKVLKNSLEKEVAKINNIDKAIENVKNNEYDKTYILQMLQAEKFEKIQICNGDDRDYDESILYLFMDEQALEKIKVKVNEANGKLMKLQSEQENIRKIEKMCSIPGYPDIETILVAIKQYCSMFKSYKAQSILPASLISWLQQWDDNSNILGDYKEWRSYLQDQMYKVEKETFHIKKYKEKMEDSLKISQGIVNLNIRPPKEMLYSKGDFIKELFQNKENVLDDGSKNIFSIRNCIEDLINTVDKWLLEEKLIERELKENIRKEQTKKIASDVIDATKNVLKNEAGKNSVLLSNFSQIPYKEWEKLTRLMNYLLEIFHFPKEFLPIEVRCIRGKKLHYELCTSKSKELNYFNLSTGQKAQLLICWTIGLNYSLAHRLPHRVIMFDDITTSLDMAQLLPAALLFRKIAYSDDEDTQRQVILTSHHEDLTNKLLDHLMPPPGKRMKVISFKEWTLADGPQYTIYDIQPEQQDIDSLKNKMMAIMNG